MKKHVNPAKHLHEVYIVRGGRAAFVERQGLRSGRKGRAAENQIYESLFHHL